MGITQHSYDLLTRHGALKGKMLELGDQNIYFGEKYGEYAKKHFQGLGVNHTSVDIQAFEGGAVKMDLSKPFNKAYWVNAFDVVTDLEPLNMFQEVFTIALRIFMIVVRWAV